MERLFKCCVCQQSFLICQEESEVFHLRDTVHTPKSCDNCDLIMRASKAARDNTVQVKCEHCGSQKRVPYNSKGYKSVYCTECIALI